MSVKNSGTTSKNASSGKSRGQSKSVTPISSGTTGNSLLTQMHPEIENEIRVRAYEIYELRGRQDGLDYEDWIRAEEEVLARYQRAKSA